MREMTAALALAASAASETGLGRQNNEDAAYSGRWLFAVADGMGGHAAGEVASAAVIESLRTHDADVGADALLGVLGQAVTEANAEVARRAAGDSARFGMGTTLTAMLLSGAAASPGPRSQRQNTRPHPTPSGTTKPTWTRPGTRKSPTSPATIPNRTRPRQLRRWRWKSRQPGTCQAPAWPHGR